MTLATHGNTLRNRRSAVGVIAYRTKLAVNAAAGRIAALLLRIHSPLRLAPGQQCWPAPSCAPSGRGCREHRIGRANLAAAFPEKSPAEIEIILRGVWDNLGRVGAEIAHLDHICAGDPNQRDLHRLYAGEHRPVPAAARTTASRRWCSPPTLPTGNCRRSSPRADGLDFVVLYRRPNLGASRRCRDRVAAAR